MTEFEMELSWLVYTATRDTWMDDAEHAEWKRKAWAESKQKAAQHPEKFADLPTALASAMNAQQVLQS